MTSAIEEAGQFRTEKTDTPAKGAASRKIGM
jgi:hypothetical protein